MPPSGPWRYLRLRSPLGCFPGASQGQASPLLFYKTHFLTRIRSPCVILCPGLPNPPWEIFRIFKNHLWDSMTLKLSFTPFRTWCLTYVFMSFFYCLLVTVISWCLYFITENGKYHIFCWMLPCKHYKYLSTGICIFFSDNAYMVKCWVDKGNRVLDVEKDATL